MYLKQFSNTLKKREQWIFAGILLLLFVLFAFRQQYGFNKNDEIFYISTVYRFFQGDAMLIDEWNNVQMFAFLTYPLYCFAQLFIRSNEGIVLIFRIFYLVFQAAVAVYCYTRMKRFGWVRIFPALFYFMTTPFNINALSYNTLAFGFVLVTLVTMASVEEWRPRHAFLCGIFTACAVLANPYAVLLFVLYGVICLGDAVHCVRKKENPAPILSLKNFVWMGLGAFTICVLFFAFIFSRGSIAEIMESLSYIVMDSERQKSFWWKLGRYFIRIHRYYTAQVYVTAALVILFLIDRKKRIPSWLYISLEILTTIPYIIYYGFFWEMVGINYMLIPLAFPGFIAYLVTRERDRRLFWCWYVPGLFYTLIAHFATNTGILTVSASCMIASAASVLLLCEALSEEHGWKKSLLWVLLAVQCAACIYQRIFYVWGDEHLEYLTETLEEGPLKGIHTTEENALLYEEVLTDMEELELTGEDKLFVVGIAPWMYLNTDAECAAYSTWETLETDELIAVYYELHPEKLPTVIYCYEYDESILDTDFAQTFLDMGYGVQTMRHGLVLTLR
ncbi:MAG: hypothetical protein LUC98_05790 [Lachnospiraceae bacterium]|nr:hypothetical protein [Lachnospiraceae bacterium]